MDDADEIASLNRRRLRVVLPLMVAVHAVHVGLFVTPAAERGDVVAGWRHGLVVTHAASGVVAALLALVAWRTKARWLGAASALAYLLHAAAIAAVDQAVTKNVTPFVGYAFGIAVVAALTRAEAIVVYVVGWGAVAVAMLLFQPDESLRVSNLNSATSASLVAAVLAVIFAGARKKDYAQRRTIDAQRAQLAALNEGLEQKVRDRVQEVEVLNARLQAQVRARSEELTLALSKLALRRDLDGKLAPGTVLGDRFEIVGALGEGGMASVYTALDRSSGGRVAVKVIQATSARQLDAMQRFLAEARSAAAIAHPAVVRMIDVGISADGLLYQAQELVDGETLEARLARSSLPHADTARVGASLAAALAAAHAEGVVHRDVKPDNVMLTDMHIDGVGVKLLDFGVAKLHDESLAASSWATRTGVVVGTPSYMAPEQVDGAEVGDRADVYALGVVLFRCITGRLPFEGDSARARMWRRTSEEAPRVRALAPDAPEALAAVVDACLGRRAEERPSAADVATRLSAIAEALEASTQPPRDPAPPLAVDGADDAAREPTVSGRTRRPDTGPTS